MIVLVVLDLREMCFRERGALVELGVLQAFLLDEVEQHVAEARQQQLLHAVEHRAFRGIRERTMAATADVALREAGQRVGGRNCPPKNGSTRPSSDACSGGS